MDGRISIHRKIMERSWYSDTNTFATFIHCLLKANIQDRIRQGVEIKRGSFISSIGNLSDEVGITRKQMLLVLQRLEKGGELVTKRDNKKTLFIIVKYSDYQGEEMRKVQQRDSKGTSKEHQRDTTKEDKKEKKKEINDFQDFKDRWNGVKQFGAANKGLPKIIKDTPNLIALYKKKRDIYTFDEMIKSVQNYCNYMITIPKEQSFHTHRFSMIEFLEQKNGLEKYINFSS